MIPLCGDQVKCIFQDKHDIGQILFFKIEIYYYNFGAMNYKHTQISYLMRVITLAVLTFFASINLSAMAEPAGPDSGTNLLVTAVMAFILLTLASFVTLQVKVGGKYMQIKFGYGIYQKKFLLSDIASAKSVKNRWYYGWGIRRWFWPKMWIYNVSGFDAVEIKLKNGKLYRIGTDEPKKLEEAILEGMR
ncbi:MAG TPA: hypothetical protein PKD96_01680 [Candidatus Absconditabacterales bacterium]|nr:hypothetical protein [Candidatus Absconditabacterales bacterium]